MNPANPERHPDELLRDAEAGAELTPGQAERLANFLLSRYGTNPEYPCTAKDSLPLDQHPTSPEDLEDDDLARAPYTHAVGERGLEAGGARREASKRPSGAETTATTVASSEKQQTTTAVGRYSQLETRNSQLQANLLPLVARLLADADLTPRQQQVARRILLRGLTAREVAWELGVTAGTVRKMWARAQASLATALEKIAQPTCPPTCAPRPPPSPRLRATSCRRISPTDIAAVYVEEVNRHGYSQPRHCPPGQEMCKRTGVCPFVVPLSELRPWAAATTATGC